MLPERLQPEQNTLETPSIAPVAKAGVPVCKSEELLQGGKLLIEHAGQLYCLRLTKAGRLLLTK
ncbi:MAG TPA: hemin uptake protein HemP [bacterium]|jgi:hemin uptake protein HemP|nr:hemin uptake protein HemP [bacterium]